MKKTTIIINYVSPYFHLVKPVKFIEIVINGDKGITLLHKEYENKSTIEFDCYGGYPMRENYQNVYLSYEK